MSGLWCRDCHVWWVAGPCWCCNKPGVSTRDDPTTHPARSWTDSAHDTQEQQ